MSKEKLITHWRIVSISDKDETVTHIKSESRKLAQKEVKNRYNLMGKEIHWELRKWLKFDFTDK